MEAISEYHGRLDEMKNIIDKLGMLKESIDNNSPKTINTEIKIYKKNVASSEQFFLIYDIILKISYFHIKFQLILIKIQFFINYHIFYIL